jgi:hypothetical protein
VAEDKVEYLRGHPLVDPPYDSEDPRAENGGDDDVIQEIAAAEMNLEEMVPMVVVVLRKI